MDTNIPQSAPAQWKGNLSTREQIQIAHAQEYARIWQEAGAPGHGQFILIAKLADKLNTLERTQS